jgi:hypothetical protein
LQAAARDGAVSAAAALSERRRLAAARSTPCLQLPPQPQPASPPGALSQALGLSPNTVKTHLRKVFAKTGVGRQTELARLVASLGVIASEARSL